MTLTDTFDLPITTDRPAAAAAYRAGVERLVAIQPRADRALRQAIEHDPHLSVAHAALAVVLAQKGDPHAAAAEAEAARATSGRATRRERQHVEILLAGLQRDDGRATALAKEHAAEFPRDLLVLYQAVLAAYFYGDIALQDDLGAIVNRAARHHRADDWAFAALHAFVLEEHGDLDEAERAARRSLATNPSSAQAAHVVAHVHHERHDAAGGIVFLDQWLPRYSPEGNSWTHLHWHQALFELMVGDVDGALARYRRAMRPSERGPAALIDATGLLWRVRLIDPLRPLPWDDLAPTASAAAARPGWAFADLHTGLALAGAGRADDALRLAGALGDRRAADAAGAAIAGFVALQAGSWAEAVAQLERASAGLRHVGGSRAQRSIVAAGLEHARAAADRPGP